MIWVLSGTYSSALQRLTRQAMHKRFQYLVVQAENRDPAKKQAKVQSLYFLDMFMCLTKIGKEVRLKLLLL